VDRIAEGWPGEWRRHPERITTPRSVALPAARGAIVAERDFTLRAGSWLAVSSRRDRPEVPVFFDPRSAPMAVLPARLGRTSFDLARQCLRDFAVLPPPAIVRVEEFVNHFDYEPASSRGDFTIAVDAAACPWDERHQLVRVSVSARETAASERPRARLTFLVRVAPTPANERARLLLWQGFDALLPRLRADDSIAIAAWGSAEGIVVPPCPASDPATIRNGLERMTPVTTARAGGASSAASELVRKHSERGALNRLIVISDGPFDVPGWSGIAPVAAALERDGAAVATAILGPAQPEFPTPAGPENIESFHADSSADAARLFVKEWTAPVAPLAERCHVEVLFNPAQVHSWRPLGFASPAEPSSSRAFRGPWRHGRQSTAVYEVVPLGGRASWREGPPDRFQREAERVVAAWEALRSETFVNVSVRYQKSAGHPSSVVTANLRSLGGDWRAAPAEWRLAAAAAGYALRLKSGAEARQFGIALLRQLGEPATQNDRFGLRREFMSLLDQTEQFAESTPPRGDGFQPSSR
jgi:Ca-activated chloride channel family protein